MKVLVRVNHLARHFEMPTGRLSVLKEIDLCAKEGEVCAVVGESGSGKTTLLQILGLLDRQTGGQYWLNGEDTSLWDEKKRCQMRKSGIGFVFQQFRLLPALSVLENVCYPLALAGLPKKVREQRGEKLLTEIGLFHHANSLPCLLSGGEQQRVAVARALAANPKLLLADEPTGNLDRVSAEKVTNMILEQKSKGCCVILITHSERLAQRADAVYCLNDGVLAPWKNR